MSKDDEERRAKWERDAIAEIEAWREAAARIGVSRPEYLTTVVLEVRQKVAFLDQYVMYSISGRGASKFTPIVELYEQAEKAWEARRTYLKDLFAREAKLISPTLPPPPDATGGNPDDSN